MKRRCILFLTAIVIQSCEYQNVEIVRKERGIVSYENDIVSILNLHCNLSGCHVNGSATGDFTMYSDLKEKIENGNFQRMVFDLGLMPPLNRPDLTSEEAGLLKRWIEAGSLQN